MKQLLNVCFCKRGTKEDKILNLGQSGDTDFSIVDVCNVVGL